ncbi:MAG TPA: aminotransferase class III-fold pyridoxal phosphate-dependent enzyme, partial [Solirubrobacteraceae bacterium]
MPWMAHWAGGFPVFVDRAEGAVLRDVDGHEYADFCLGDTGAMAGHAPAAVARAVAERYTRGATVMLPSEDAPWVGEELTRRFGLPRWQLTLSATDANRFALRLARGITGRPKVLVFAYCYHGTVDESFALPGPDGRAVAREGNVGPPVDPDLTTKVVEFNDVAALEAALAPGDVACVLAEPALTNIGIVLAEPGFHAAMRELTRAAGTLLIIDETHTLCCGPGGGEREGVAGQRPPHAARVLVVGAGVGQGALGHGGAQAERPHGNPARDGLAQRDEVGLEPPGPRAAARARAQRVRLV